MQLLMLVTGLTRIKMPNSSGSIGNCPRWMSTTEDTTIVKGQDEAFGKRACVWARLFYDRPAGRGRSRSHVKRQSFSGLIGGCTLVLKPYLVPNSADTRRNRPLWLAVLWSVMRPCRNRAAQDMLVTGKAD